MIVVEPMAGLANRMRVIHSASLLAGDTGKDLTVAWTPYQGLNCPFGTLFEKPQEVIIRERDPDLFHETRLFSLYSRWMSLRYSLALDLTRRKNLDPGELDSIRKARRVWIASPHLFYQKDSPFFPFRPRREIADRIQAVTGRFPDPTWGVHIRRADHRISIETSSTDKFVARMRGAMEKEPNLHFFLSTDHRGEEERLRKEFGDRILATEKVLSRNSEQGIIDALVDLYCLSGTARILGSYYSSFSEVAAWIRGIPLEIVS